MNKDSTIKTRCTILSIMNNIFENFKGLLSVSSAVMILCTSKNKITFTGMLN